MRSGTISVSLQSVQYSFSSISLPWGAQILGARRDVSQLYIDYTQPSYHQPVAPAYSAKDVRLGCTGYVNCRVALRRTGEDVPDELGWHVHVRDTQNEYLFYAFS